MHVITKKTLVAFWTKHPAAKKPLSDWHTIMEHERFADFNDLILTFGSADYVKPYTVFNIGGNKYRLIVSIHYNNGKVYIREVFTHPEYDLWTATLKKRKGK